MEASVTDKRDNTGFLSRNKKCEHDRQPEFRGSCVVDGVEYWLSGWVKQGDDGKFFSLAFTRKEKPAASQQSYPRPSPRRP